MSAVEIQPKLQQLQRIIEDLPGAVVAYSGGADSALVAEVAHRWLGPRAISITADSPSLPRRELDAAVELARSRGWRHEVVKTSELADERYASNPTDRCYFCKTALFERLMPLTGQYGWPVLLGTNMDDLGDWRPGNKAADEHGARHPLLEAGMSKVEIREASRLFGLPTHDKPASACLASRFAYGVRVTSAGLRRVEEAENELLNRDFEVVRVRDLGDDRARVEVGPGEVPRLKDLAGLLTERLTSLGFKEVSMDEKGYRRGALNDVIPLSVKTSPQHRSANPSEQNRSANPSEQR
jgi:uncharacterized protein